MVNQAEQRNSPDCSICFCGEKQNKTLSSLHGFQMKGDKATPVASFTYCNLKQEKYRKVSLCLTKA